MLSTSNSWVWALRTDSSDGKAALGLNMILDTAQTSLLIGFGKPSSASSRPLYLSKLQASSGSVIWFKTLVASDDSWLGSYLLRHSGGEDSEGNIVWAVRDSDSLWLFRLRASDGEVLTFAKVILN